MANTTPLQSPLPRKTSTAPQPLLHPKPTPTDPDFILRLQNRTPLHNAILPPLPLPPPPLPPPRLRLPPSIQPPRHGKTRHLPQNLRSHVAAELHGHASADFRAGVFFWTVYAVADD